MTTAKNLDPGKNTPLREGSAGDAAAKAARGFLAVLHKDEHERLSAVPAPVVEPDETEVWR